MFLTEINGTLRGQRMLVFVITPNYVELSFYMLSLAPNENVIMAY